MDKFLANPLYIGIAVVVILVILSLLSGSMSQSAARQAPQPVVIQTQPQQQIVPVAVPTPGLDNNNQILPQDIDRRPEVILQTPTIIIEQPVPSDQPNRVTNNNGNINNANMESTPMPVSQMNGQNQRAPVTIRPQRGQTTQVVQPQTPQTMPRPSTQLFPGLTTEENFRARQSGRRPSQQQQMDLQRQRQVQQQGELDMQDQQQTQQAQTQDQRQQQLDLQRQQQQTSGRRRRPTGTTQTTQPAQPVQPTTTTLPTQTTTTSVTTPVNGSTQPIQTTTTVQPTLTTTTTVPVGRPTTTTTTRPQTTTPITSRPTGGNGAGGSGASPSEISEWLALHNASRAAKGLKPVTWNAEIARMAQAYADTCKTTDNYFKHSPQGNRKVGGVLLGENLAMGGPYSSYSNADLYQMWADEEKDYDPNTGKAKRSGAVIGHYTAIMQRNLTEIGCAISQCKDGSKYAVCNYNPIQTSGQKPY